MTTCRPIVSPVPTHTVEAVGRSVTVMRFGIFVPQGWRHDLVGIAPAEQWTTMRDLAQAADAGPWESIWVYDHFHTVPVPSEEATHEAWTLMSAFAASTSRVRLGQMCTCMSYRNPAYLAKVASTIDIISGGRVEMGIGGGWYEHEWRAYGYGFPPAKERLGRLREGVEIMHQAWTTGSATLDGTTTRWTVPGSGRDPCRRTEFRSGSRVVAKRVTLASPPVTRRPELRPPGPEPSPAERAAPRHSPAPPISYHRPRRTQHRDRRDRAIKDRLARPTSAGAAPRCGWSRRRAGGVPARSRRRHTEQLEDRTRAISDSAMPSTTSPRPPTTDPGSSCSSARWSRR